MSSSELYRNRNN